MDRVENVQVWSSNKLLAIRLPMLPRAQYRARTGEHPYRVPGLTEALRSVPRAKLLGKLRLLILHYHSSGKNPRRIPDFDNYDTKNLIDTIMAFYGGDHPLRLVIVHACEQGNELPEGTYVALFGGDIMQLPESFSLLFQPVFGKN